MTSSPEPRPVRATGEARARSRWRRPDRLGPALCVLAGGLAGCAGAFDPKGPNAGSIAGVWWLMFGLGTAVYVAVLVFLGLALRRARRRDAGEERPPSRLAGMPLIVGGGVVVPALVLVLLTGVSAVVRPLEGGDGDGRLHVEIEGRRYWWHITYPDEEVVTANEVVIPTGRPVELSLTSEDVIHSFWVPELAGKVDMVPGQTNEMTIEADEPGEYDGACAEYCGLAHAQMRLRVIAMESAEYDRWVERQVEPAPEPDTELALQGQQTFMGSACVYCHTIEGTTANSRLGPDLTHVASRTTLAAGLVPNNRGHLAAWILDPQDIKPGNAMPATDLSAEELRALLAYMETLE